MDGSEIFLEIFSGCLVTLQYHGTTKMHGGGKERQASGKKERQAAPLMQDLDKKMFYG